MGEGRVSAGNGSLGLTDTSNSLSTLTAIYGLGDWIGDLNNSLAILRRGILLLERKQGKSQVVFNGVELMQRSCF